MTNYTVATAGLYPAACSSQNAKQRDARLKKFEFIGRLLAQALIDARMVSIFSSRNFDAAYKFLHSGRRT